MMQRLQNLGLPLKLLVYAGIAAAVLAVAAGVGATVALVFVPEDKTSAGEGPQRAEGARPEQAKVRQSDSDPNTESDYLDAICEVQNGAVEASVQINGKLLRYDRIDAGGVEEIQTDYERLGDYKDRVKDLDPPEEYADQYKLFVLAIDELYVAGALAYRLVDDPTSATQAGFDAYDQHVDKATDYLQRSNETLDRDYKTTETARDVGLV